MSRVPRLRIKDDERGTALMEFAIILPFMLVITLAVVDLSRAFYMTSVLTSAAREGAITAIRLQTPATDPSADNTTVKNLVQQALWRVTNGTSQGVGLENVNVNVGVNGGYYTVTVSGEFKWLYLGLLNFLGGSYFSNPQTLTASATAADMLP